MNMYFKTARFFLAGILLLGAALPGGRDAFAARLPTAVQVVLSRAHELIQDDKNDHALEILRNFRSRGGSDLDPERPDPRGYHHPEIHFAIANLHLMAGDLEKAGESYKHALAQDPGHVHARLNLARVYYEQEAYASASEHFLEAYILEGEKEPEYLYYAAVTLLMENAYEPSVRMFERLVENHAGAIRPEWRENLVHALLSTDRMDDALHHIEILAETYEGEKRIQWQEILLYQYIRMEKIEQAESYALELTREAPANPRWWKALAHVALTRNNYENAVVALTIYSYLEPLTMAEKQLLADLNLQVGIPRMAAPGYEAMLSEKPDKNVLRNLVIAYQQMGQREKAVEVIEVFDGYEDDPEIMMLKADIHYALGEFEHAANAYGKVSETEGRHTGRAWLMTGYAAWQSDDLPRARDAFKKAAAFKDQEQAALSALEQLSNIGG